MIDPDSIGKAQTSVEYLIIYSLSILIIAIAIGIILTTSSSSSLIVPSSCNFVSGLDCHDIIVATNAVTHNTMIALALSNPLSYAVYNVSASAQIKGQNSTSTACFPTYIQPGGTIICVFSVPYKTTENQFVSGSLYANYSYCALSLTNQQGQCNSPKQAYLGYFTSHAQPEIMAPSISLTITSASPYAYTNGAPDKLSAQLKILGYPIGGDDISFTENTTSYKLDPILSPTDSQGIATSAVSGTIPGQVLVTATFAGVSSSTVVTFINQGRQSNITTTTVTTTSTTTTIPQVKRYTLTTASQPTSAGTAAPLSGLYDAGNVVTISETPASGYTFTGWTCTGTGCYAGTDPSTQVTVNTNMTETADFVPTPIVYTLTTNAVPFGGGAVTPPSGNYVSGNLIDLNAIPALGYSFVDWTCTGTNCNAGTSNSAQITITSNVLETANFKSNNEHPYLPIPELVCNLTDSFTYYTAPNPQYSYTGGISIFSNLHNNNAYYLAPLNNSASMFSPASYSSNPNTTLRSMTQKGGYMYIVNIGNPGIYGPMGPLPGSNFSIVIYNTTNYDMPGVVGTNIANLEPSSSYGYYNDSAFNSSGNLYVLIGQGSGMPSHLYVINSGYLQQALSGTNAFDSNVVNVTLPSGVADMASDGRYIYLGYAYQSSNSNEISVFDTVQNKIVYNISLGNNSYGMFLTLHPTGAYLYAGVVSSQNSNNQWVDVINTSIWAVTNSMNLSIPSGSSSIYSMAVNYAGTAGYIGIGSSNVIRKVNVLHGGSALVQSGNYTLPGTFVLPYTYGNSDPYGNAARNIVMSPDNSRIYFLSMGYYYGLIGFAASLNLTSGKFNLDPNTANDLNSEVPTTMGFTAPVEGCSSPTSNYYAYVLSLGNYSAGPQFSDFNAIDAYETYNNYNFKNLTTLGNVRLLAANLSQNNTILFIGGEAFNSSFAPFVANYNLATNSTRFVQWQQIASQILNNVVYTETSMGKLPLLIASSGNRVYVITADSSQNSGGNPYVNQGAFGDIQDAFFLNMSAFHSAFSGQNLSSAISGSDAAVANAVNTIQLETTPGIPGTAITGGSSIGSFIGTAFDTIIPLQESGSPSAASGNQNCSAWWDYGPLAIPVQTAMEGIAIKNNSLYLLSNQKLQAGSSGYNFGYFGITAYWSSGPGDAFAVNYSAAHYLNLTSTSSDWANNPYLSTIISYPLTPSQLFAGAGQYPGAIVTLYGNNCNIRTVSEPRGYTINRYYNTRLLSNSTHLYVGSSYDGSPDSYLIQSQVVSQPNSSSIYFVMQNISEAGIGVYNTTDSVKNQTGPIKMIAPLLNDSNNDGGLTMSSNGTYLFDSYPTSYGEWGNGACVLATINLHTDVVKYLNLSTMPCGHVTITPDGKFLYVGTYELSVYNLLHNPMYAVINPEAMPLDSIYTINGANYVAQYYIPGQVSITSSNEKVV